MDGLTAFLDWLGLGGVAAGTTGGGLALWRSQENKKRLDKHSDKMDGLSKELSNYKTHVAEHYATSHDVRNLGNDIKEQLQRIENKLDRKVDK